MQCTSGYAGGWLCHLFLKDMSWFLSGGIRLGSHKAGLILLRSQIEWGTVREGILNDIAFKAIESTESLGPQLSICCCKGSISVEYYAKIAVFFGVLDGLASQSECFRGFLFKFLIFSD